MDAKITLTIPYNHVTAFLAMRWDKGGPLRSNCDESSVRTQQCSNPPPTFAISMRLEEHCQRDEASSCGFRGQRKLVPPQTGSTPQEQMRLHLRTQLL